MHIDDMPANREMDALVAEKVMGLEVLSPANSLPDDDRVRPRGSTKKWLTCEPLPHYSTDIAAAWQIVERFRFFVVPWGNPSGGEWAVADCRDEHLALHILASAESAPLAICRTALTVVGCGEA